MDSDSPGDTLFAENLEALKKVSPELARQIGSMTNLHTHLVRDDSGRLDLALFDRGLYDADARTYAERQVAEYMQSPQRMFLETPNPDRLTGAVGDYCVRVSARLKAAGLTTASGITAPDSHFLFCFGVGLGFHIERLIAATSARIVVLIEPNLEFLWHSLHAIDWQGILREPADGGRIVVILTERDPAVIAERVGAIMLSHNSALLDGTYFFTHYASSILASARDQLRRDIFLTVSGLGYFEDERVMTRNTVAQLSGSVAKIIGRMMPERSEPIFLIGSGPSLDKEIEFIRESRPRVVLMSLGTALRALLAAGIKPDFHIELENTQVTAEAVAAATTGFDISGITLVASITVPPSVPKIFGCSWLYFRERMSPTLLFGQDLETISPSGPTVANAGVGAAFRLGFRELYFFGLDMGSKDKSRFHSQGTIYGSGMRAEPGVAQERLPGNFGGEAIAISTPNGQPVLNWSRHVLESLLARAQDARVYNCSDGVRIAGAIPRLSRAVTLPEKTIDRKRMIAEMDACLYSMAKQEASRRWAHSDRGATAAFTRMRELLEAELSASAPQTGWLADVFGLFRPKEGSDQVMRSFLAGTVMLLLGTASWFDRHLTDRTQALCARKIAYEELLVTVAWLESAYAELMSEIDEAFAPAASTVAA